MQVNVHFRNTKATDALRDYALRRLSKVDKLLIKPEDAQVTLAVEKQLHIATVQVRSNGEVMTAREEAEDLYAAIDLVVDKVERQARRYKEKLQRHR
jgi:putative sigma-54 modulation protein